MFFSILIPVYNVERYLPACIESVLSQDEQDFEMLLVDDGSTDRSGVICDEYVLRYPDKVRVIHKKNEGLLLTRRCAIREAKGEWFVHLDSDDYMLPGSLKAIRETAERSSADLVLFCFVYGRKNTADFPLRQELPFRDGRIFEGPGKHDLYMQFLYRGRITSIWQKAAKRAIVDIDADYHQWPGVSLMEDHLQSLPLLEQSKRAVFLDRPIIYYRYNENSITKKKPEYLSCEAAFWSQVTVFREEQRYRERWRLTERENALVCAKHLRTLCGCIGKMSGDISRENKGKFRSFLQRLSVDSLWIKESKTANKKILGPVSRFCVFFVRIKSPALIRLLYFAIPQ